MKGIKNILFLLIVVFLLAACASPLKKRLLNGELPQYSGTITPLTIPFQPEYSPEKSTFYCSSVNLGEVISTIDSGIRIDSIYESEESSKGISQTTKLGDMFIRDVKLLELTENYQTIKPDIPIVELKILMDKYGRIKESEISLPFFEQPQFRSVISEEKLNKIKTEAKKLFPFCPHLSRTPIITGSKLYEAWLFDAITSFTNSPQIIEMLKGKEEPNFKVNGWAYFEGRKALVSTIDYSFELSEKGSKFQIMLNGYSLWDAETLLNVRSEVQLKVGFLALRGNILQEFLKAFKQEDKIPKDPSASADITFKAISICSSEFMK